MRADVTCVLPQSAKRALVPRWLRLHPFVYPAKGGERIIAEWGDGNKVARAISFHFKEKKKKRGERSGRKKGDRIAG